MRVEVSTAVEELKRQFSGAHVTVRDDAQGGGYVVIEPCDLGPKFQPRTTWLGFHIPAQYPYADIYPMFMGAEVRRADGVPFQPPLTLGPQFEGRAAIQISRRNAAAQSGLQKATAKVLKVLDYLGQLT